MTPTPAFLFASDLPVDTARPELVGPSPLPVSEAEYLRQMRREGRLPMVPACPR